VRRNIGFDATNGFCTSLNRGRETGLRDGTDGARLMLWHNKDENSLCRKNKEKGLLPTISMFYGIIVSLYFVDNKRHQTPHIHVKYQDAEAVVSIPDGGVLEGQIPPNKMRLVLAWVEIHKDDLIADWDLAVHGQQPYKIEPLR